jgi:hypothetical protein
MIDRLLLGNTICRLGNTDASASNMDLSTQKTIQPGTDKTEIRLLN